MSNDKTLHAHDKELETFEFVDQLDQQTFVNFLKKFVTDIEQGKIKIMSKDPKDQTLDVKVPKEILIQVEYDKEEMVTDESKNKYYFALKLFWSDLGIETLITEETKLEDEEEDDEDDEEDDIDVASEEDMEKGDN